MRKRQVMAGSCRKISGQADKVRRISFTYTIIFVQWGCDYYLFCRKRSIWVSQNQRWEELGKNPGYNGVLKLMQMMNEKKLVTRDVSTRSHVYSAEHNRVQTSRRLLSDLKTKVFQGSASKLVLSALTDNPVSTEELQEIRALLDKLEKEKGKK